LALERLEPSDKAAECTHLLRPLPNAAGCEVLRTLALPLGRDRALVNLCLEERGLHPHELGADGPGVRGGQDEPGITKHRMLAELRVAVLDIRSDMAELVKVGNEHRNPPLTQEPTPRRGLFEVVRIPCLRDRCRQKRSIGRAATATAKWPVLSPGG